jgi:hypothetical protein
MARASCRNAPARLGRFNFYTNGYHLDDLLRLLKRSHDQGSGVRHASALRDGKEVTMPPHAGDLMRGALRRDSPRRQPSVCSGGRISSSSGRKCIEQTRPCPAGLLNQIFSWARLVDAHELGRCSRLNIFKLYGEVECTSTRSCPKGTKPLTELKRWL